MVWVRVLSVNAEHSEHVMPLIPDAATFQKRLAALPLRTYQEGEVVFAARSKTGQLLILRNGAVAVVKGATEIAKIAESPAPCSANSPRCWISRTQRTCAPWKPSSFTSLTRPPSCKTRPRSFTSPGFWHDVSIDPISRGERRTA